MILFHFFKIQGDIRNEKEHFEVEKVIDDYSQYPYEMFFRENKDRI